MKKNSVYALMSAIALASAVGFSSCSSTEDEVNVNPGYNPDTGEVPVNFLFNVSTSNTPTTRMSSDNTQALTSASFRGIDDSHIMCFKQTGNGQWLASPTTAASDFEMKSVVTAGSISTEKSSRVLEMALPLKTNTIVFYGRASGRATSATDTDSKNKKGYLEAFDNEDNAIDGYHVESDLNNVYFHLARRLSVTDKAKLLETEKLLATILTCVMNVNRGEEVVTADQTPTGVANKYKFDIPNTDDVYNTPGDATSGIATYGTKNMPWSRYVYGGKSPVDPSHDLWPLEEKLARVYKEMTSIQTAELRNGSGPALISTIQSLWSEVNAVRCADPVNEAEALAKYMAELISLELQRYFTVTTLPGNANNSTVVTGVEFNTPRAIVTNLTATAPNNEKYWPTGGPEMPNAGSFGNISNIALADYLNTFPADFDLPQGATHIKFNANNTDADATTFGAPLNGFYYAINFNSSAAGGGAFTVEDYYYPAELLYFGNSPIRVSDKEHAVNEYPQKTSEWDKESAATSSDPWFEWTANGEVLSSTRSVAMRNDINYGSALLATTVGYTDEVISSSKLEDNNAFIQNRDYDVAESNKEIEIADGSFTLKGILVGGQSPRVGWNFLPVDLTETNERQGFIFDKDITNNGEIKKTTGSEPNYTLVFDNYKAVGDQETVYIALELQNNSNQDFFGRDNIIPNGSNFYLIGELNPAGKEVTSWPTYHALPPYTDGTHMNNVTRIFIQDYMTTAHFKIGKYSLQYAYLTVPDLRSGSVTLGLSVDIKWSTGLSFEVVIGGETNKDPNAGGGGGARPVE